jgi:hypothetical protein
VPRLPPSLFRSKLRPETIADIQAAGPAYPGTLKSAGSEGPLLLREAPRAGSAVRVYPPNCFPPLDFVLYWVSEAVNAWLPPTPLPTPLPLPLPGTTRNVPKSTDNLLQTGLSSAASSSHSPGNGSSQTCVGPLSGLAPLIVE